MDLVAEVDKTRLGERVSITCERVSFALPTMDSESMAQTLRNISDEYYGAGPRDNT